MAYISVASSALQGVDYNLKKKELLVIFTDGDSQVYYNVPHDIYNAMMTSHSIGAYFNQHIRNDYRSS